jgi:hypothetical protein
VLQINEALGRPVQMFASQVGEMVIFNAGHYELDKNAGGWALEEQVGNGGAVMYRSKRMPAATMSLFLQAYLSGIMAHKCNVPSH